MVGTIQNYPDMIEVYVVRENYIVYKSGSMILSDVNYVTKDKLRRARLSYSSKKEDYYFIDSLTHKKHFLKEIIAGSEK